jgi:hypothetical protein
MAVYPFDPPESVLKKDDEHFKEDDSGKDPHSLTEQPSSPSIEFSLFPLAYKMLNHFRRRTHGPWTNLRH